MQTSVNKCLVISDFNTSNLVGYLNNDIEQPRIEANGAPFGQVSSLLIENDDKIWTDDLNFAIVWTRPQDQISSFSAVLNYQQIDIRKAFEEVDSFCDILLNMMSRVEFAFIPMWVLPSYIRGRGLLDMKQSIGSANILHQMNLRVCANLDGENNIYVLNTQKWIERVGGKIAFNPKLWYMGKIAFGNEVLKSCVTDIKAAINGLRGNSKKLIILDLDDTLWGGIVGDDGWENLRLGGHDAVGEAYVDFQSELKAMTNRGILLAIVSKNEETVALEAIKNHPEMILKVDDFAGWKINWNDKAQNIVDLVSELNLGLQSVVFIDDNPVERARIRETLPEILVPEWPEDKMMHKKALCELTCFDSPSISNEDAERTKMYITERQRENLKANIKSVEEWMRTLEIKVKVELFNEANLTRTAQLLNKTNQMNLSTRRLTESELLDWLSRKNRKLWTFRVSDKFGDSGLTGIISVEVEEYNARIIDFILSCRVFGRKIEETMLHVATEYASAKNVKDIFAIFIPTPKNKPCLDFFKKSGFNYEKDNQIFSYHITDSHYPTPKHIKIEGFSLSE